MTKLSKLKIILGLIYLLIVGLVTFLFFHYEVYNYVSSDFIKNDRKVIINFIEQNIFIYSFLFFLFSTIWFFLLGFGFPLVIAAGFIFGTFLGSILLLHGLCYRFNRFIYFCKSLF
jgi:uncharacterized membrane protein YdjX (TVP38/TMEM64 family)